jgi:hypothetical protein
MISKAMSASAGRNSGNRVQSLVLALLPCSGLIGQAATVDLLAIDAHRLGGGDAEADLISVNGHNGEDNIVCDDELLTAMSRKHQHFKFP